MTLFPFSQSSLDTIFSSLTFPACFRLVVWNLLGNNRGLPTLICFSHCGAQGQCDIPVPPWATLRTHSTNVWQVPHISLLWLCMFWSWVYLMVLSFGPGTGRGQWVFLFTWAVTLKIRWNFVHKNCLFFCLLNKTTEIWLCLLPLLEPCEALLFFGNEETAPLPLLHHKQLEIAICFIF